MPYSAIAQVTLFTASPAVPKIHGLDHSVASESPVIVYSEKFDEDTMNELRGFHQRILDEKSHLAKRSIMDMELKLNKYTDQSKIQDGLKFCPDSALNEHNDESDSEDEGEDEVELALIKAKEERGDKKYESYVDDESEGEDSDGEESEGEEEEKKEKEVYKYGIDLLKETIPVKDSYEQGKDAIMHLNINHEPFIQDNLKNRGGLNYTNYSINDVADPTMILMNDLPKMSLLEFFSWLKNTKKFTRVQKFSIGAKLIGRAYYRLLIEMTKRIAKNFSNLKSNSNVNFSLLKASEIYSEKHEEKAKVTVSTKLVHVPTVMRIVNDVTPQAMSLHSTVPVVKYEEHYLDLHYFSKKVYEMCCSKSTSDTDFQIQHQRHTCDLATRIIMRRIEPSFKPKFNPSLPIRDLEDYRRFLLLQGDEADNAMALADFHPQVEH